MLPPSVPAKKVVLSSCGGGVGTGRVRGRVERDGLFPLPPPVYPAQRALLLSPLKNTQARLLDFPAVPSSSLPFSSLLLVLPL